jgi:Amt family ammonium transporter
MRLKYLGHLGLILAAGLLATFLPTVEQVKVGEALNGGDTAWMLTASGLVLLMTPGLSFFYGGMVSKKNVISTMLQSMVALGVISVTWIAVGFSLCFGDSIGGIIGNPLTFFMYQGVGMQTHPDFSPTIPFALFSLFQLKFAIITPALVSGAFAERVKFSSYLVFMVLFSLFIYAPLAHMTWHPEGILRNWGVLDFAGGTVVHISAGMAALAGSIYLGPRKNLTHDAANIPFVILGTGLLWFGWFGFNAGSSLGANETAVLAFLNTNTASAVAMLTWMFFDRLRGRKSSAMGACIGAVVGLVGITPAAGFVSVGSAILIGFITALVSNLALGLKAKSGVDDTLDVFPCHGLGGIVGMILTAVFAKDVGLMYGETKTFLYHLLALVIVMVFAYFGSYILYIVSNAIKPLRVNEEEERQGLDLSQHGESA